MALGSLSPERPDCLGTAATSSFSLDPPTPRPPSTLLPSSSVSYLLHLLLHPPSLLHSVHNQPAAKSLSWFAFFFSLPPPQCRQPLGPPRRRQQSAQLPLPPFFPCSPEVRLATSYPKRRKLPVNVIFLFIRFSPWFSRTASPSAPPSPVTRLPPGLPFCCRVCDSGVIFGTPRMPYSRSNSLSASLR